MVLDCYAPAVQLGIDVDGPIHDADVLRDIERDAILNREGIEVLHFTSDAVRDHLASVLERIRQAVNERRR